MTLSDRTIPDLWTLVQGTPWIDPDELLCAVRHAAAQLSDDYRTRLLLAESIVALEEHLGDDSVRANLGSRILDEAHAFLETESTRTGFPSLRRRLMRATTIQVVEQFLRELGTAVLTPAHLEIGGSVALILAGLMSRHTEDIDVVDEIPAAFRGEPALLDELAGRYGLRLTHFQSHYLPQEWHSRLIPRGTFGSLTVTSVDPIDIAIGKLFSARAKDRDDLRMLAALYSKFDWLTHVQTAGQTLWNEPQLRQNAQKNWYILFGESLTIP